MRERSAKFKLAMRAYDDYRSEDALRLMEECAKDGEPMACLFTGAWYQKDRLANEDQSARWLKRFEQFAMDGDAEAQWVLGQHYRFGTVFSLDIERANYWLNRAAESGDPEAQHQLACYLEFGLYGYPVDSVQANNWYEQAFKNNNPETLYLYAIRSFHDGKPTQRSLELLKRASDMGLGAAREALEAYPH